MNLNLIPESQRNQFSISFNMDALLRGNVEARYNAYRIGRESGFLSVNEIRRMEGLNGIGDQGDTYLQPLNFTELGSAPNEEDIEDE